MNTAGPAIHFVNVAYFFQLLYNLVLIFKGGAATATGAVSGSSSGGFSLAALEALGNDVWLFVCLFAWLFCIICMGFLVYYTTRFYQIEDEEKAKYGTVSKEVMDDKLEHSRWNYIRQLIESPQESDWRAAIIEADIMLDEMLSKLGYGGATIADKLKTATTTNFHTLQDAWEAHKVRNDIAHAGSMFQLSPNLAYRTIGHSENVFREFHEI